MFRKNFKIILIILLAAGLYASLYFYLVHNSSNAEDEVPSLFDDLLVEYDFTGLPFTESKNEYKRHSDNDLEHLYVTVFPTYDNETKEMYDINTLNSVLDVLFDPEVEVLFQKGNSEGPLLSIYDSNSINPNGIMSLRGFSSRLDPQKSYRIKLNSSANTFKGQTTINLNKHYADPLRITNKFCMDAIKDLDHIGSLNTYFVKLYIKDLSKGEDVSYENYGLYTMVEQPSKNYLKSRNLDKNGALYKPSLFVFNKHEALLLEDDPKYNEEEFEKIIKIRENPDHEKLLNMIDEVNDLTIDINDVIEKHFNRDNYITWMALNILYGNIDATSSNFLLYSPLNSSTWYFIPWDYDKSLYYSELNINEYHSLDERLMGIQNFWGVILHKRFFQNLENLNDLTERIQYIKENHLNREYAEEFKNKYLNIVRSTTYSLPDIKYLEVEVSEMDYQINHLYEIIDKNYQRYLANLERPMPIFISAPEIIDNNYTFTWDTSFDPQGDKIYYTFELARDSEFNYIVYKETDLEKTSINIELDLVNDIYYYRVTMVDENGNSQTNIEEFVDPVTGDSVRGALYFEVRK